MVVYRCWLNILNVLSVVPGLIGLPQGYLHAELNWRLAGTSVHVFPSCHQRIGSCEWGEWIGGGCLSKGWQWNFWQEGLPLEPAWRLVAWEREKLRGAASPGRRSNCWWSSQGTRERGSACERTVSPKFGLFDRVCIFWVRSFWLVTRTRRRSPLSRGSKP